MTFTTYQMVLAFWTGIVVGWGGCLLIWQNAMKKAKFNLSKGL